MPRPKDYKLSCDRTDLEQYYNYVASAYSSWGADKRILFEEFLALDIQDEKEYGEVVESLNNKSVLSQYNIQSLVDRAKGSFAKSQSLHIRNVFRYYCIKIFPGRVHSVNSIFYLFGWFYRDREINSRTDDGIIEACVEYGSENAKKFGSKSRSLNLRGVLCLVTSCVAVYFLESDKNTSRYGSDGSNIGEAIRFLEDWVVFLKAFCDHINIIHPKLEKLCECIERDKSVQLSQDKSSLVISVNDKVTHLRGFDFDLYGSYPFSPYNENCSSFSEWGKGKKSELEQFVFETEDPFKVWAVEGPAGSGKTRLAIELAQNSANASNWLFWKLKPGDRQQNWTEWQPEQDTVIIIDYCSGFEKTIPEIVNSRLRQGGSGKTHKVRLLVLNRHISCFRNDLAFWGTGAIISLRAVFYQETPLSLYAPSENDEQYTEMIKNLICEVSGLDSSSRWVAKTLELLQECEGAYYPFYALLAGEQLKNIPESVLIENYQELNFKNVGDFLADYIFTHEDRYTWKYHDQGLGLFAASALCTASLRSSISTDLLLGSTTEELGNSWDDVERLLEIHSCFDERNDSLFLNAIKPDVVAEYYVAEFFNYVLSQRTAYYRDLYQGQLYKVLGLEGLGGAEAKATINFLDRMFELLDDASILKIVRKLNPDLAQNNALKAVLVIVQVKAANKIELNWKDANNEQIRSGILERVDSVITYLPDERDSDMFRVLIEFLVTVVDKVVGSEDAACVDGWRRQLSPRRDYDIDLVAQYDDYPEQLLLPPHNLTVNDQGGR